MNSIHIEDLPGEVWKEIENYPLYQVSNMGRVKSIVYERYIGKSGVIRFHREQLLRPSTTKDGYKRVTLTRNMYFKKTFSVHRLVAIAFIPNPLNLPEVNHLSENKGDNRVCNLKWASSKENANYGNSDVFFIVDNIEINPVIASDDTYRHFVLGWNHCMTATGYQKFVGTHKMIFKERLQKPICRCTYAPLRIIREQFISDSENNFSVNTTIICPFFFGLASKEHIICIQFHILTPVCFNIVA